MTNTAKRKGWKNTIILKSDSLQTRTRKTKRRHTLLWHEWYRRIKDTQRKIHKHTISVDVHSHTCARKHTHTHLNEAVHVAPFVPLAGCSHLKKLLRALHSGVHSSHVNANAETTLMPVRITRLVEANLNEIETDTAIQNWPGYISDINAVTHSHSTTDTGRTHSTHTGCTHTALTRTHITHTHT